MDSYESYLANQFRLIGLFLKISAIDTSPGALSTANATMDAALQDGITPSLLRAMVVNARQYESFLRTIEGDLVKLNTHTVKHCEKFKERLTEMCGVVMGKNSLPTTDVYVSLFQFLRVDTLLS